MLETILLTLFVVTFAMVINAYDKHTDESSKREWNSVKEDFKAMKDSNFYTKHIYKH